MAERSPKHGLTRTARGWVKRINRKPKWICSDKVAPTGAEADEYWRLHFAALNLEDDAPPAADDISKLSPADLVDLFADRQRQRRDTGKIAPGTCAEAIEAVTFFADALQGQPRTIEELEPRHFAKVDRALSGRFGVDRRAKFIVIIRGMFKWGRQPPLRLREPDYGDGFSPPARRDFRLARKAATESHGAKAFKAVEIRQQLRRAKPAMAAMIYLAINAGFGNTDLAELPQSIIDLKTRWLDYTRGKTGADRKAWLWPETVAAIKQYLAIRPKAANPTFEHLLFLTRFGLPYIRDQYRDGEWTSRKDQIGQQYGRFLKQKSLKQSQPGRNFYSLRRTYRTTATEVAQALVVDFTMGHAGSAEDMGRVYTTGDLSSVLKKVSNHVRSKILKRNA